MNNMVDEPGKDSGCTAVVALLKENELYVANAGKFIISTSYENDRLINENYFFISR